MHNLKTATKFFPLTSRNIRITFYNEQKISKPPKNPWESPSCFSTPFHLRTHTSPPLPSPPPQSKHGFVPRSLARFQAANKQRNNSARRGGWFLETRKRRVGVARPVTSSFVAAMTPESLESTRPFGQPFTLTRMIAFQSSILCVPFRKRDTLVRSIIRTTNENFEKQSYLIEFSQIRFDSSRFSGIFDEKILRPRLRLIFRAKRYLVSPWNLLDWTFL